MTRPRYEDLELHVPEPVVRTRSHRPTLTAVAIVIIAVLVIIAASRGGSNPGQLHGPGLTGSVLRPAPRVPAVKADPPTLGASLTTGTATWYCGSGSRCTRGYGPSDMVAAIDTDTGYRKGDRVTVRHAGKAVTVRIVDVCGCAGARVIDLTSGAFRRLAPLSRGVIPVTLSAGIALPPTDIEGER